MGLATTLAAYGVVAALFAAAAAYASRRLGVGPNTTSTESDSSDSGSTGPR